MKATDPKRPIITGQSVQSQPYALFSFSSISASTGTRSIILGHSQASYRRPFSGGPNPYLATDAVSPSTEQQPAQTGRPFSATVGTTPIGLSRIAQGTTYVVGYARRTPPAVGRQLLPLFSGATPHPGRPGNQGKRTGVQKVMHHSSTPTRLPPSGSRQGLGATIGNRPCTARRRSLVALS